MYTTILHPLRKAYSLSMNEYAVLDSIYLLSNNTKYGGWCIQKKEKIASDLDLTKQTVHKILNILIEKELIEKDYNTSHLRTTDEWNELMSNKSDWAIAIETESVKIISSKVTPSKESLLGRVKKVYSPSKESLLHYNNKEKNINKSDFFSLEEAEAIYKKYPRKKSKAEGIAKLLKLKRDLQPQIEKGFEQFIGKDPKFIPHFSTYINKKRWEDEEDVQTYSSEEEELRAIGRLEFGRKYGTEKRNKVIFDILQNTGEIFF